jgi:four helix bundle protein
MGVKKVDELIAFQLAHEFKLEAYRITGESPEASRDLKFKGQLFEAASGVESCIAEGFRRWLAPEFAQFLRYALASLEESEVRLRDGVDRGYFTGEGIAPAGQLAKRCRVASLRLHHSLQRFRRGPNRRKSGRRTEAAQPHPRDPSDLSPPSNPQDPLAL